MGANMFADGWQAADTSKYTGRRVRQLIGMALTKSSSRLLGARTGVNPAIAGAAGAVTATTSTWTVNPHGGWLDLEASAVSGPYPYSFDTAATGSMTAPSSSNPRLDSIFIQVNDPTESDGTSTPDVIAVYAAGSAGAPGGARGAAGGPPNFPNSRCMELAQITVPISGGGSPSVQIVAPYQVAAGGILPCRSSTEYPATPYPGQAVYDIALRTVLVWDSSVSLWIPPNGPRVIEQVLQVASWGDYGGGTMSTLATCPGIPVPKWAQDGSAVALITAHVNQDIITNPGSFSVRVAMGGVVPTEAPQVVAGNAGSSAAESANVTVGGTFTIPAATTSMTPAYQAQRTAGTGALRIGTGGSGLIIWTAHITR
jgi:hypothetical protein